LALTFQIILRHEVQRAICIAQEEERGQAMPPSPEERTQDGIQDETRLASTRMASFPLDTDQEQNAREDAQLPVCASTAVKKQQQEEEDDEGARPEACKSSPMLIAVAQVVAALVLLALALFILLSFRLRLRVPLVV
jgi:hypothetical protein